MTKLPDKRTVDSIRDRLSHRLNDHLCGMREGCDDSVTGFNEAWDVMRKLFDDIEAGERDDPRPAASPLEHDLLEALKGVVRVADRATVEFDAARAAIAKAVPKGST